MLCVPLRSVYSEEHLDFLTTLDYFSEAWGHAKVARQAMIHWTTQVALGSRLQPFQSVTNHHPRVRPSIRCPRASMPNIKIV